MAKSYSEDLREHAFKIVGEKKRPFFWPNINGAIGFIFQESGTLFELAMDWSFVCSKL